MNRRGMSLVELLMVLVIVGIIGAIAGPRYAAATSNYRVDAAARRIGADFALAQATARATSLSQTVTFDSTAMSYQVTGLRSLDNTSSTYAVSLGAEPYRSTLASVSFGATNSLKVSFNLYGLPSSGGTVVVRCGGFQRTITVDAATGQVTIQ